MDRARAHEARAAAFTDDHLRRRQAHIKHPVFDFLFEYYPVRPATLRTWHPGLGVGVPADAPHASWRDYTLVDDSLVTVDLACFMPRRGAAVRYIHNLLQSVSGNPAHFDCFGLHEWAMVYKAGPDEIRHDLPLRLGHAATDAVVESHQLKCTHFDAFRFFTEPAIPLNLTVLTREAQPANDQCGCLHATMDLYKWAAKLGPLVPGEVLLDAFELARDTRVLDMEASPYDCRGYGFGVVAIETPEGKAEYVARQRALAARAKPIRDRLVSITEQALTATLSQ
ncbi:3-methyladenine DNA glycosylase [Corynebacterium efficiens]|nr:3-methyladenine DNA glycosylase [Corynebacterium efficiens]